jgi:CHAT domain-containing protein
LSVYPSEMVDPHANGCPEPEVLAAYVDRGLSLSERARVDVHLASCPQCIALVAGAARTVAELSAQLPDDGVIAEATPWMGRRSLAGVLAAAAAVIAVVAAPSLVRPWLERDSGLVSLVDSVGEHRSVLGRLTGGFPHAPLDVPSAGGQDGQAAGTDRVQLTAGRIRESFGDRQTPAQLHAVGVSHLLSGRYDDAAMSLLAASREQPQNARYLNDVATVQLERARRGVRPDDLPRALAAADRAVRLNPSLSEAWFNRALAASALSLNDLARASWTEYLKRDSGSAWSGEARARLDELARPTPVALWAGIEARLQQGVDAATAELAVRTQTTEARNFTERQLGEWAAAVLAGNDGGAALERVRTMAQALQRVAGDAMYIDSVATIERAQGSAAQRALATAHRTYAAAMVLYMQERFADATPGIAAAKVQFEATDSPFVHRVSIDAAGTTMGRGDLAGTLATVTAAKAAGQARGYAFVSARASWFEGLIAFAQGRLGDTQAHYEDALREFERMGDAEQVALVHNLLSAYYAYLGDKRNEWEHRQGAMQGLSVSRSERVRSTLLASSATLLRAEFPEMALALHDASLASAQESGRRAFVVEIFAQRALTKLALGRTGEAEDDVREARRALAQVTDPRLRETYELLILAPEGELLRAGNPAAAVAVATRALDVIRSRNTPADRSRVPAFQLQLAKANIVWGNRAAAKVALADGIRAFDAERAQLTDEGRVSQFDQSWQLFETAVQLAVDEKDYPRAFEMSERARLRSLAEAKRATPRPLADVQADLQANEAIVALNQFNDSLAIWVIRHDGVNVTTRAMSRVDASRLLARHQDEIWQELSQPVAGRDLYNHIVRPIASNLHGATKVVFVPDQTYQDVAFAALWDGTRQRFLVEDVAVSLAPSVGAYASRRVASADSVIRNPLVLGASERDAEADARVLGALYSGSSVVAGAEATRRRFLEDARAHSLVHVAAQTTASQSNPLMSRLKLSDEAGRRHSGTVLGREIAAQQFAETNLVVLDEVAATTAHRGEGTLSLARAFLAAGVPAVLGTLPGANETAARDLMIAFHREMSRKVSAEQALQTVQRNAIQQNGRRLGAWSALVLYGSDR